MNNKPEKINEEIIFSSKYRSILWKRFKLKDWEVHKYIITSQPENKFATMVLAFTKGNKIILCREFRYWVEDFIYTFPIWMLEKNLSEIENVKKELKEESWYFTNEIQYLWETIAANYDDTLIKYYFAKNCIEWIQDLEIWEYIEVFNFSLEDFENMIRDWKILCPLTLSCFTLAKTKWLI